MAAQFCRLAIVVEDPLKGKRLFRDAIGDVVPAEEYPLQPGSVMLHWADPVRAAGWFAEAWRLLNDTDRLAALSVPVNTTDKAANHRLATMQFQYIAEILGAIAHGYNQLNVIWHNDPIARQLYREYFSGPPKVSGMSASGVFDKGRDYNPDWYTKDEFLPRAHDGSTLQKAAVQAAKGKVGDRFAPSALLVVVSMDPLPDNGPVALSRRVFNAPVITTSLLQTCPVGPIYKDVSTVDFVGAVEFPWRRRCESKSQGFGTSLIAFMPDGSELPSGFDDWRAAYGGMLYHLDILNTGDRGITAPLNEHMVWLRRWVNTLVERSPLQVIQDTRAYTAWQNLRTLTENASALQEVAALGTTISQQQHATDPGWELAAGTLAVAGGVAATVGGPVGAVVGLVAGATAAVIKVTDAVVNKGTKGIGRDDLGRYKPQLERAWLSGDVGTSLASAGAPSLPTSELQDPPGLGTVWSPMDCPAAPIAARSAAQPGSGSVSGWWGSLSMPQRVGIGLGAGAAGAGLLFMASRASQPTPQPQRSRAK